MPTQSLRRLRKSPLVVAALVASTSLACSSGSEGGAGTGGNGSSGMTGSGGFTASAGASSLGGATGSTGGSGAGGTTGSATGGSAAIGGATGVSGAASAGGTAGDRGAAGSSMGGAAGSGSGATAGNAGVTGGATGTTGGAASPTTGGTVNTGGKSGVTGGSAGAATGGATGTTGGAASTGGAGGASTDPVKGQMIGFATLNGGTTGGKAGQTVTASTYEQLKTYAESATAYVILVAGTIENGANGGIINVKSNKSIVGVGSTGFLNGIGLNIINSNNIIIQNLRITLAGITTRTDTAGVYTSSGDGGLPKILVNDGDAISISGTSKNIWIDHCELFSQDPAVQTNKDLYDGLIDIKGQTGFITISWCYLHDHHKGGLVGASDTDLFADRKVTLHHNYYNKVKLRVPMYRGAVGHFFNNYVVGATDASEIRAGTCLRVEKNYYEALHYSIYTTADSAGSTERIDNVEVMRTERAYPANCTADIPYPYSSVLTGTTADVKTVVPQSAGVGKL